MNRNELDIAWAKSHPILLFIFLASLVITLNVAWADVRTLSNGGHPEGWKWVNAGFIGGAVLLAQAFRRRRNQKAAEQQNPALSPAAVAPDEA